MANQTNTIVHEWFEKVWNQGRGDEIERLLAPDAMMHGLKDAEGSGICGPKQFRPFYDTFRSAFPNLRVDIDHCIRDGDTIAFRCTVSASHLGDGIGIPATRRDVKFAGMGYVREANGQIAEAWNAFDFQDLYSQLS